MQPVFWWAKIDSVRWRAVEGIRARISTPEGRNLARPIFRVPSQFALCGTKQGVCREIGQAQKDFQAQVPKAEIF